MEYPVLGGKKKMKDNLFAKKKFSLAKKMKLYKINM